MAAAWKAVGG